MYGLVAVGDGGGSMDWERKTAKIIIKKCSLWLFLAETDGFPIKSVVSEELSWWAGFSCGLVWLARGRELATFAWFGGCCVVLPENVLCIEARRKTF